MLNTVLEWGLDYSNFKYFSSWQSHGLLCSKEHHIEYNRGSWNYWQHQDWNKIKLRRRFHEISLPIMIVSIKHLLYVNLTCDWRLFSKFIFFTKFSSVSICFFLTSTSARLKICSFYTHETSSKQKKLLKYWDMGLTSEQCWTWKLLWFVPELIAQGVKSAVSSKQTVTPEVDPHDPHLTRYLLCFSGSKWASKGSNSYMHW